MNERKIRNQKGAAVTGLVLALFFFIMLIGFFCFDTSRLQMAQRELTATCDSASLAGTAMLTGIDTSNDDVNHTKLQGAQTTACQYARNMFQAGNLLGSSLANANVVSPYSAVGVVGTPGSTNFMISLADPTQNYQGVPPGPSTCVNGKAIMCYACYAYQPVFLWIVGVTTVGLNAASGGGLPQVDAVMVFDFSGSMDDATNVSFVRRTWDSSIGSALLNPGATSYGAYDEQVVFNGEYGVVTPSAYPGVTSPTQQNGAIHYIEITPPNPASHRLSDYVQFDYTNKPNGLSLNVLPPQNIDQTATAWSLSTPQFYWDQNLRTNLLPFTALIPKSGGFSPAPNSNPAWSTDYGTPPGNCTLDPPYGYGQFYNPKPGPAPGVTMYKSGAGAVLAVPGFPNADTAGANMAYWPACRSPFNVPPSGPNPLNIGQPNNYDANNYNLVSSYREFTDIVVNIADPGAWPYQQPLAGPSGAFVSCTVTFPPQEPDGNIAGRTFTFEDLGVLVEAARGNLDNAQNAKGALLDRNTYWTIPENGSIKVKSQANAGHVSPGYQEAYQRLAMLFSQPIATALDGADGGFFQKVNSLCDCRFGFCGFSNADNLTVGATPNSKTVGTAQNTSSGSQNSFYVSTQTSGAPNMLYWWHGLPTTGANNDTSVAGGVGIGFRTPRRPLIKSETQANSVNGVDGCQINGTFTGGVTPGFSAAWNSTTADANGLENGTPIDDTDTYEAVNTARYMFLDAANYNITNISSSRPAAKHAIVFFSDGVPTGGVSSTDATGALTVAQACKGDGIAIYSIGMDVTNNPILQADQVTFLGNATSGLAGAASNGSRFFQCTSSSTVKQAFNAVARRLAQSQR
jgi:hypothetical protein